MSDPISFAYALAVLRSAPDATLLELPWKELGYEDDVLVRAELMRRVHANPDLLSDGDLAELVRLAMIDLGLLFGRLANHFRAQAERSRRIRGLEIEIPVEGKDLTTRNLRPRPRELRKAVERVLAQAHGQLGWPYPLPLEIKGLATDSGLMQYAIDLHGEDGVVQAMINAARTWTEMPSWNRVLRSLIDPAEYPPPVAPPSTGDDQ